MLVGNILYYFFGEYCSYLIPRRITYKSLVVGSVMITVVVLRADCTDFKKLKLEEGPSRDILAYNWNCVASFISRVHSKRKGSSK